MIFVWKFSKNGDKFEIWREIFKFCSFKTHKYFFPTPLSSPPNKKLSKSHTSSRSNKSKKSKRNSFKQVENPVFKNCAILSLLNFYETWKCLLNLLMVHSSFAMPPANIKFCASFDVGRGKIFGEKIKIFRFEKSQNPSDLWNWPLKLSK